MKSALSPNRLIFRLHVPESECYDLEKHPETHHGACGITAGIKEGKESHAFWRMGLTDSCPKTEHRGAPQNGIGSASSMPGKLVRKQLEASERDKQAAKGTFFVARTLEPEKREAFFKWLQKEAKNYGLKILKIAQVDLRTDHLAEKTQKSAPLAYDVFFKPTGRDCSPKDYEYRVYQFKLHINHRIYSGIESKELQPNDLIPISWNPHVLIRKGMGNALDHAQTWPELLDEDYEATWYAFHRRFSTNTFPTWWLTHPFFRSLHNGEIGTDEKNKGTLIHAQKQLFRSKSAARILIRFGSDSFNMDTMAEVHYMALREFYDSGTALMACLALIIPPAQQSAYQAISRDFYQFLEFNPLLSRKHFR